MFKEGSKLQKEFGGNATEGDGMVLGGLWMMDKNGKCIFEFRQQNFSKDAGTEDVSCTYSSFEKVLNFFLYLFPRLLTFSSPSSSALKSFLSSGFGGDKESLKSNTHCHKARFIFSSENTDAIQSFIFQCSDFLIISEYRGRTRSSSSPSTNSSWRGVFRTCMGTEGRALLVSVKSRAFSASDRK